MKETVFRIALLIGLSTSLTVGAQNEKVTLRVPQFARPLVERWIGEYQKTHEGIDFQFVAGNVQSHVGSLSLTTDDDGVFFARYAVLPVTTHQSEAERQIGSRSLNDRKLKSLFFVQDDLDDEDDEQNSAKQGLHIYTGNSLLSASRLYAAHFKQETADYKGKKISGDDSFLNTAISRDPLGVTVNSLSNIFDLQSRLPKKGLSLLQLDIDKQGRQVLKDGNLDDLIRLLEQEQYAEIPVGKVGFKYDPTDARINDFVNWVLSAGTQYLHEYGFLQLPHKESYLAITK